MVTMRRLGNMIWKLSKENGITDEQIAQELQCERASVVEIYKGRLILSFEWLDILAELFDVSVETLLEGDDTYYAKNVVHCMTAFSNEENREKILDFIDSYLDIYEAATAE